LQQPTKSDFWWYEISAYDHHNTNIFNIAGKLKMDMQETDDFLISIIPTTLITFNGKLNFAVRQQVPRSLSPDD